MSTLASIYKEYLEATRGLETSADRERQRIAREVTTQEGKLEGHRATIKSQLTTALGTLEAARLMEMRKRDLPVTKPSRELLTRIAGSREDVQGQAAKYRAELDKLTAELKTAEAEALESIAAQVRTQQADIEAWKATADKEYAKWEAQTKAIETTLAPFKTPEGYDLGKAIDAGIDINFLVFQAGFDQMDIHNIVTNIEKMKEVTTKLKPFEMPGGFDITGALQSGISQTLLRDAGFLQQDISNAVKSMVAIQQQTELDKTLAPFMTTYNTMGEAYKAGAITLSQLSAYKSAELFPAPGKKIYSPLTTYDLSAALKAKVPIHLLEGAGFSKADIKEIIAYDTALANLKPYMDKEGSIDIVQALKDKKITTVQLKLVGISDKAIKQGEHYAKIGKVHSFWEGMTPWEEWKGEKATTKGVGEMAAVMLVPGVWAKDWNDMSPTWRAINIAIDIAFFIPFVGWVARGAKIGAIGLRGLRISSKAVRAVNKAASAAEVARDALVRATKALNKIPVKDLAFPSPRYLKAASNVQNLAKISMKADRTFTESLMKLTKVTPGELAKFEKLSKMPGIKKSVVDVGKAQSELSSAWKALGKFKVGTRSYIQQLTKVQKAQTRLDTALGGFDKAMRPRAKVGKPAGWDKVIRPLEKELKQASDELERLLAKQKKGQYIDPDYLKSVKDTVKSLKAELHNFRADIAAGDMPPLLKGYGMKWTKDTPDKLMSAMDDILKGKQTTTPGIQQPLPFKGAVATPTLTPAPKRVAVKVAVKPRPAVKTMVGISKLRLKPVYKPAVKPSVAKPKVPSVMPGVKAKPKVYERKLAEEGIDWATAHELARMPQAAREKLIQEALREAGIVEVYKAIVVPFTKGLTTKQRTRVQAATMAAVYAATRAKARGQTQAQIMVQVNTALQPLTRILTKAQIKPLTKAVVRTTTKLGIKFPARVGVKVRVKPKPRPRVRPKPRIHIRIPLPDGKSRLLTKKEAAGVIAWKQGFMYKLTFTPYGQKQIVNTRKPIDGVVYHRGAGSAMKSIIAKGGVVPREVTRDMGIVDVIIRTPKGSRKPHIRFRADRRQRTRATPTIKGISTIRGR